jgi:hypothetical protein
MQGKQKQVRHDFLALGLAAPFLKRPACFFGIGKLKIAGVVVA